MNDLYPRCRPKSLGGSRLGTSRRMPVQVSSDPVILYAGTAIQSGNAGDMLSPAAIELDSGYAQLSQEEFNLIKSDDEQLLTISTDTGYPVLYAKWNVGSQSNLQWDIDLSLAVDVTVSLYAWDAGTETWVPVTTFDIDHQSKSAAITPNSNGYVYLLLRTLSGEMAIDECVIKVG